MPIMDKYTPTYSLSSFKKSDFATTMTALKGAATLGMDFDGIKQVVSTMKKKHFYKSMTSKMNHKIWQDVYHVPFNDMIIYVKFTEDTISEFKLLSFKEK